MEKTSTQFVATAFSAEVARILGRYKELAHRGAVAVTSHGRNSVVLLSAKEYNCLKTLDTRLTLYAHELPEDLVKALEQDLSDVVLVTLNRHPKIWNT